MAITVRGIVCGVALSIIAGPIAFAVPAGDVTEQRRLVELGGYLGVFFPSSRHELFERGTTHERLDDAVIDFGLRVAYMHFFFLGAEAELGMMPTGTSSGSAALVYTARAHLLAQYPVWKGLTPFALVGGGLLGVASGFGTVGSDVDPVFHWGFGLKYYISPSLAVRGGFRHDVTSGLGLGHADHFEFLLGAAWVIGWRTDSDGDGVFDGDDRCPRQRSTRLDGCPPADRDGDGVIDERDRCPQTRGLDPDGCPPEEEDPDGDGIKEERDKCPRKSETFNGFQDADGCPDELPDPLKEFHAAVQGVVTFASGKTTLNRQSYGVLDSAASVLKKEPKLHLLVRGHTDNVGKVASNVALSRRRAEAVQDYLIAAGLSADRVSVEGVGPAEPVADNATKEGRALNRRIELVPTVRP